ncbi:MAG: hypothetical protein GC129_05185 [Proteobacteria bacterium]|nr:hypothetical protein [Pseudomonadota bacterium]
MLMDRGSFVVEIEGNVTTRVPLGNDEDDACDGGGPRRGGASRGGRPGPFAGGAECTTNFPSAGEFGRGGCGGGNGGWGGARL